MILVIVLIAALLVGAVIVAAGGLDRPRRTRRVAEPTTRVVREVVREPIVERTVTERRVVEDDGVL